jgi:hypothetical protein
MSSDDTGRAASASAAAAGVGASIPVAIRHALSNTILEDATLNARRT